MARQLESSGMGMPKADKRAGAIRVTEPNEGKLEARRFGERQFVDPNMPVDGLRWCSHRRRVVVGSVGR